MLAALEESREEVVGGLDDVDLSSGAYEGGWNGRQLLAHIASMEWTYPRILELPAAADEEAAQPRDTSVTVDDYNRRQVERREGVPVEELIEEFVRNRARTIEAVTALPEEEFGRRVRSAGGTVGRSPTSCGSWPSITCAAISPTSAGLRTLFGEPPALGTRQRYAWGFAELTTGPTLRTKRSIGLIASMLRDLARVRADRRALCPVSRSASSSAPSARSSATQ